ncbi:MAG: iron-sulfur cluster assembly scaffold protein [Chloroflexota bacterium]
MFSETLLDHFEHPRNCREMSEADAEGEAENPVCGDKLHIWIRVKDGQIEAMTWRAEGCVPTIAAASAVSEMVRRMPVAEARSLDRARIAQAIGGIPARKAHAAQLVETALRNAVDQTKGMI